MLDEHFYAHAAAFQGMANRHDSFDRSGPKIFVGEYAAIEGPPFAHHGGDVVVPATLTTRGGSPLFQRVTKDRLTGTVFLELVNAPRERQPVRIRINGVRDVASRARR